MTYINSWTDDYNYFYNFSLEMGGWRWNISQWTNGPCVVASWCTGQVCKSSRWTMDARG